MRDPPYARCISRRVNPSQQHLCARQFVCRAVADGVGVPGYAAVQGDPDEANAPCRCWGEEGAGGGARAAAEAAAAKARAEGSGPGQRELTLLMADSSSSASCGAERGRAGVRGEEGAKRRLEWGWEGGARQVAVTAGK